MNLLKTLFLIVLITLSILSIPVLLIPINSERSDVTVYAAKFDGKVKGIVKFIFSPGENVKIIAVVPVEAGHGAEPYKTTTILQNAIDAIMG